MLYPLTWPTVALGLPSREEFPWGWDVHSTQGNKAPAGHSNLVLLLLADRAYMSVLLHIPVILPDLPPSTHWQEQGARASLYPQ